MNRFGRRIYVLFIALSLLAGGGWAAVGQRLTGNTRYHEPATASEAARDLTQSLAAPVAKPNAAPDLGRFTAKLPAGEFLVGTGNESLAPDPTKVQWDSAKTPCVKEDQSLIDPGATHLAGAAQSGPPAARVGPSRRTAFTSAATASVRRAPRPASTRTAGVTVRSIAISNGNDDRVWQSLDMVGFFSRYRSDLCPQGCGMFDIREAIAGATAGKLPAANIAINATHTHGGADGYGAWGGLPDWYRAADPRQVAAVRVRRAARPHPGDHHSRRGRRPYVQQRTTRHVLLRRRLRRGVAPSAATARPRAGPAVDVADPVLATLVNFAAHPTVLGDENTLMHSRLDGHRLQGTGRHDSAARGIVMEGALGNVSPSCAARRDHRPDRRPQDERLRQRRADGARLHVVHRRRHRRAAATSLRSNRIVAKTVNDRPSRLELGRSRRWPAQPARPRVHARHQGRQRAGHLPVGQERWCAARPRLCDRGSRDRSGPTCPVTASANSPSSPRPANCSARWPKS